MHMLIQEVSYEHVWMGLNFRQAKNKKNQHEALPDPHHHPHPHREALPDLARLCPTIRSSLAPPCSCSNFGQICSKRLALRPMVAHVVHSIPVVILAQVSNTGTCSPYQYGIFTHVRRDVFSTMV